MAYHSRAVVICRMFGLWEVMSRLSGEMLMDMMLDDLGSHVTKCTSRRREVYVQRSPYLVT